MTTLIEHHLHAPASLLDDHAARLVLAIPVFLAVFGAIAAALCAWIGA